MNIGTGQRVKAQVLVCWFWKEQKRSTLDVLNFYYLNADETKALSESCLWSAFPLLYFCWTRPPTLLLIILRTASLIVSFVLLSESSAMIDSALHYIPRAYRYHYQNYLQNLLKGTVCLNMKIRADIPHTRPDVQYMTFRQLIIWH